MKLWWLHRSKREKSWNTDKKLCSSTKVFRTTREIYRKNFAEDKQRKEESESKSNEKESNKESSTNYYKLEDINTLKDLSFIKDNEDLWDRIKLKSGNEYIKLLLLGNKNANKRVKIEYICFGKPKFEGDWNIVGHFSIFLVIFSPK